MKPLRFPRTKISILFLLMFLAYRNLAGAEERSLLQGGFYIGQAPPGSRPFYGDRPLALTEEGYFLLGFGRDADLQQQVSLVNEKGEERILTLTLQPRKYKIERINGISRKMMSPSAPELERIGKEARLAATARQVLSQDTGFLEDFIWPLTGRISGIYGSQRILNGEQRRPHFGIDIAAPRGTVVVAPADGVVRLAHPGMFFSGKTLIIDHGFGLSSSYLHLKKILVKEGERVRQGEQIALVGASGRVTGPHLDWRINWFDTRLDPVLWVPKMPEVGR